MKKIENTNFSNHEQWPESFKKIHYFILKELETIPGNEFHKYLYFILISIERLFKNTVKEDVEKVDKIIKDWIKGCLDNEKSKPKD